MTVLVALLAILPFVMLAPALARGGYWPTGASGLFPSDQLQYMAQIREASHLRHVLDHFPLFFVSGLGVAAGLDVRAAFLLWLPVSLVILVGGFDLYVRAFVATVGQRTAALALGLFYFSPAIAAAGIAMSRSSGSFEQLVLTGYYLFPAGAVWGYPQIAIALGLMPVSLLYTARAGGQRGQTVVAATSGAVVSFLHPWQGLTLVVIHVACAAWTASARTLRMAAIVAATALPAGYYWLATHLDSRLELAAENSLAPPAPAWIQIAALAPLAVAGLALRRWRPASLAERQLVIWPIASLLCYWLAGTSWQPYFLLGTTLPLSILLVRATRQWQIPRRAIAVPAILLLTVPGIAFAASLLRDREYDTTASSLYRLHDGESHALAYVARAPGRGGVMASGNLAAAAWAFTDRRSWAANLLVSPEFDIGRGEAANLFAGRMAAAGAQRFVERTRVAYVVSGCDYAQHDLTEALGPLLRGVQHFGCATVYEVR